MIELTRSVTVPPDVDLRAMLAMVKVSSETHADQSSWWASRTPAGLGTVRLVRSASTMVTATAWGPGADWLLEQLPTLLTADDPSGFTAHHEVVERLVHEQCGVRLPRTDRVFEALVPAILGQKVQTVAARQSLRALISAHGEDAPGPTGLRLLPEPERVAELGYAAFHPFNVEKKRAVTILNAAHRATWLESLGDRTPAQRLAGLQQLRGIGPWTAAVVALTAWADADAVPVGDFHIPNTVAWNLAGEERGTDERMLELLEPYAGHRGRVIRMLKGSGRNAPRRGPKLGVIDFRRR